MQYCLRLPQILSHLLERSSQDPSLLHPQTHCTRTPSLQNVHKGWPCASHQRSRRRPSSVTLATAAGPGIVPGMSIEYKQLHICGIRFRVADVGSGPAVLLLHGFPCDSSLWKHQIPALQKAGYRVIAPDLRGCGETELPQEPDTYRMKSLVADVAGILDALEIQKAAVIGHDWGAILAWAVAATMPERTAVLCAISVGHPNGFFKHEESYQQKQKSWYMLLFQHKPEAEEALMGGPGSIFPRPTKIPKEMGSLQASMRKLTRPGAATAGLNWYRANVSARSFSNKEGWIVEDFPSEPIRVPTLGIMCEEFALTSGQMKGSERFIQEPGSWRYVFLPDVNDHMIPWEAPDEVNKLLLSFLQEHKSLLAQGKL